MFKDGAIQAFSKGVLKSYSQIFFSESSLLAIPLIIVSFLDVSAGFCGLLSVITANLAASYLTFNKQSVSRGFYGFNSLLVGLGLGYYYEMTLIIIVIAVLSGFFTCILTVTLQGILDKYYLPSLSLPFVIGIWIVLSAGRMLSGAEINQEGVYILNRLFNVGGYPLVTLHEWWIKNITSEFLNSYFLSLGAIFFQFNVFAGLVIAIALLFYSRIAFLLSLVGYSVAWLAYLFLGMDLNQIGYIFIGFNFILGAIAIGGYFYIPSRSSFLWAFAMTPIIALTAAGLSGLLKPLNMILVSLPFNLTVITFIYSLRFRTEKSSFKEVVIQQGTPEQNLYSYQSFISRFPNFGWLRIKLPFYGEWVVDQGHNGEHTHKGDWAEAWDFVIKGRDDLQYINDGRDLQDYHCFGQNVLAPADGTVVVAEDGTDDNPIGEVNLTKNWGNTVIIKHSEGLYSKLSHLKKGSVIVKPGDYVHYGQILGKAGNSGRSPYPHLHFQLQLTPYIGSKTLKYPLFAFFENGKNLKTFSYPGKGQRIIAVEETPVLKKAFNLCPGTKLSWSIRTTKGDKLVNWEVITNTYNKSYLYCNETKSVAYFENDGIYFCFTHFDGDRSSLLYSFYLAAFRVPLVFKNDMITTDSVPANRTFSGIRLFLHDFSAPFFMYLRTKYEVKMEMKGSSFDPDFIRYSTVLSGYSFKRNIRTKKYILTVNNNNSLKLEDLNSQTEARCESY
jgi:urea transporter